MAENSKNGKGVKNADTENKEKKSFFKDDRVRFTVGLFVLLFGIYFTLALLSYIFTWKIDQSFEWQSVFSGSDVKVSNWTGRFGAIISAQFMNRWFGLPSIAFSIIIFAIGLKLLRLYNRNLLKLALKVTLGVLVASLVCGFLFGNARGFLGSGVGGAHGLFVSNWISAILGKFGAALLLLLVTVAYVIYIRPSSLHGFEVALRKLIDWLKSVMHREKNANQDDEVIDEKPEEATVPITIPDKEHDSSSVSVNEEVTEDDNSDSFELASSVENMEEPIQDLDFSVEASSSENLVDGKENVGDKENVDDEEKHNGVEFTVEAKKEEEVSAAQVNKQELYDPSLELSHYQRPLLELLEDYRNTTSPTSNELLVENKNKIVETLSNYKIQIDKIKATVGPTVTLYEIVPAPGIRISKIKNLEDDIALSLAALGIRIIAPIPGKGTIGIEVPNQHPEIVSMHSIIKSQKFQDCKYELAIALGKTISNEIFILDLAKLPHLLVAGATGQGKSVGLNAIITSLLYKKHPAEIKFVLVDPKKVELTLYSRLEKHFLAKLPDSDETIITDTQKVINTLNSLCIEMDSRYELLKQAQVRNIKEYNEKFIARRLNPNKGHRFLPYIIVIIDEFADLIMTAGREVEMPIARLAQLARAIGIHLIIATQRPSTNIITGVIKANFPARIAFRVSSMIDSRTILDHPGANNLIGRGDMLVSAGSDMVRVQCAFVDIPEIERITDFIGNQQGFASAFLLPEYVPEGQDNLLEVDLKKRDELFEDAARLIVQSQMGSTSLIQRKFSIGYNRAGRIIDQLEAAGIVGPFEGSKARQVLIVDDLSLEQLLNNLNS
ncbi:MAG TPA: DNA translocase FtsK 4TM domain-containing protein [Tenuifilaceae bacterium]|nr:DNA translocase FtsK 4TM domain-containing protein [Tenuifilaceae bacterium]